MQPGDALKLRNCMVCNVRASTEKERLRDVHSTACSDCDKSSQCMLQMLLIPAPRGAGACAHGEARRSNCDWGGAWAERGRRQREALRTGGTH